MNRKAKAALLSEQGKSNHFSWLERTRSAHWKREEDKREGKREGKGQETKEREGRDEGKRRGKKGRERETQY